MNEQDVATIVRSLWEEALGQPVEPSENFYDLGGSSLIAVHISIQIEARFGIEYSVAHIFDFQTAGEMSAHVYQLCRRATDGLLASSSAPSPIVGRADEADSPVGTEADEPTFPSKDRTARSTDEAPA